MSGLGWLLLKREWRRGETMILMGSLVLVVATIYVLVGFANQLQTSLQQQSATFLGGDRRLSSSRPLPDKWQHAVDEYQLDWSKQLEFDTMAVAHDALQLVEVTVVDEHYPLQGEFIVQAPDKQSWQGPPPSGAVFVEHRLATLLALKLGEQLGIGQQQFTVAGWLSQRPEAGFRIFGGQPSVIMNPQDVAATGVVQQGSRLTYRWLLSGNAQQLTAFDRWLKPRLEPIQRYQSVRDRRSLTGRSLQRTAQFLKLSGMLTVLLGTAALAVAMRRFCQRQGQPVALLKTLGANKRTLQRIYLQYLGGLVMVGLVIGSVVGCLGLNILDQRLATLFSEAPAYWLWSAWGWAMLTALSSVILFVYPQLLTLARATPRAVLAGDTSVAGWQRWLARGALAIWLLALLYLLSGDGMLSLVLFVSGVVACWLIWGVSLLWLLALERLRAYLPMSMVMALTAMRRRLAQNRLLLMGFVAASMLVLVIYYARADMLQQWRAQLPKGAANHFAINVPTTQVDDFQRFLEQHQWSASKAYLIVRGRLVAVNQQPAKARVDEDSRGARQAINRELTLTSAATMPAGNELTAGQFNTGKKQVSVASGVAERLGLKLGDQLTFDIGGLTVSAQVTSFREVDWNSLRPNFFMMLSPDVMADIPHTYLLSFRVPDGADQTLSELVRRYRTVTLIDIDQLVDKLAGIIQQAGQGMTIILILVVFAAVLLLCAQIQSSIEARQHELVVMQTLGARRRLLLKITLAEFAALGVLAGLIASVAVEGALAMLYAQLFELTVRWHPVLWLLGPVSCALVVMAAGWLQCRHLLRPGALQRYRLWGQGG